LIDFFIKSGKIGCFLAVKTFGTFHVASISADGYVKSIRLANQSGIRINGGFFVFKKEIFDYINEEEDLVDEPFQRLIKKSELVAYEYDGFWGNLDTYKDKQRLDELASKGKAPWEVWKNKNS
jgi:glucose-1-phosphate cytidylyltransferase